MFWRRTSARKKMEGVEGGGQGWDRHAKPDPSLEGGLERQKWQPLIAFPVPPPLACTSLPSSLADPSLEGGLARQKRVSGKPQTVGRNPNRSHPLWRGGGGNQIVPMRRYNSLKSTVGRPKSRYTSLKSSAGRHPIHSNPPRGGGAQIVRITLQFAQS